MTPSGGEILVGVLFVAGGCLGAAITVEMAQRSRNWLYLIVSLGCAALVAGVVGQRAFPSDDAKQRFGDNAESMQSVGPWDAGWHIPVINIKATPIALVGFLVALGGLALVLFFEPVPSAEPRVPLRRRALEDDDAV